MNKLMTVLHSGKLLCADGAWGTYLFKKGLMSGTCPEYWNLTHENEVFDIAKSYIDAGSDIIETNSFGASRFKLTRFNLDHTLMEINEKAVQISRRAAGENKFVMASLGPTGKFLVMGDVTEDELYDSFKEQAIAFSNGGADAVCIETYYALDEAQIAIKAVKENTELPVACTFTYDKLSDGSFKTMMGVTPKQMTEALIKFGADIVGANCGLGFESMIEITKIIRETSSEIPILVQANAGLPELKDGIMIYNETPLVIKNFISQIIDAGANIIGGCCGTTPQHISEISKFITKYNNRL